MPEARQAPGVLRRSHCAQSPSIAVVAPDVDVAAAHSPPRPPTTPPYLRRPPRGTVNAGRPLSTAPNDSPSCLDVTMPATQSGNSNGHLSAVAAPGSTSGSAPRTKQVRVRSPGPGANGSSETADNAGLDARPPPKRARKAINCEPCRNSKLKCDRCVHTQHRLSFPARPLAALARLRAPPRISALANDISSLSSDLQKPPLLVLRAQRCVLPAPSADASLTRSRVGTTSLCYQGQDADPSLRGVLDQQYVSTLPCSPSLFCGSLSSPSSSSTSGGLLTLRPSSLASDTR